MCRKREVVDILKRKGYKFNGKEFEREKGSRYFMISVKQNVGNVFIWNSKNNRTINTQFQLDYGGKYECQES